MPNGHGPAPVPQPIVQPFAVGAFSGSVADDGEGNFVVQLDGPQEFLRLQVTPSPDGYASGATAVSMQAGGL